MRFNAARAAGELELKSTVKRLMELLNDPDSEVQSAAIASLGQIGGNAARGALQEVIESEDAVLAPLAQEALDELEFVSGGDMVMFEADADTDEDDELDIDDLEDEDEDEDEDEGADRQTSTRKK